MSFVTALTRWYDGAARDLPWRRTRDPYAIWLSEVMLQQTRVDTVIPYYERFLVRYPDVSSLAAAPLDEVLSAWSGLGYYRRARELWAAAREVTERFGGVVPSEAAELRTLRGIGAYTAGAVASIAWGRREPLVDGNVARVLARAFAVEEDVRSAAGQKKLWALAARLVPEDRPGRFNQALMELGATVCAPDLPRCEGCPLGSRRGGTPICVAARDGRAHELPVVRARKAPPVVKMFAAVVEDRGLVLVLRRKEGGLFGGLWEPPMVEAASTRAARAALLSLGVDLGGVPLAPAGDVRHVLSHRELQVSVVRGEGSALRGARPTKALSARLASLGGPYERAAWLDLAAADVGISSLTRKVLAVVASRVDARPRAERRRPAAAPRRP